MSSLKDLIFDRLLNLPLRALKVTGFNFLASLEEFKATRKQKFANRVKKLFFWINFFACVLFGCSRAVFLFVHLHEFEASIEAHVDLVTVVTILVKTLLINFNRSRILEMFEGHEGSSYDSFSGEVQQKVGETTKVYKIFEIHLAKFLLGILN